MISTNFYKVKKILEKFFKVVYYLCTGYFSDEARREAWLVFQKGDLVFNKYRILDLIGKGAFGEVYLAEHIYLNINRAIKCITRYPDENDVSCREADILKRRLRRKIS